MFGTCFPSVCSINLLTCSFLHLFTLLKHNKLLSCCQIPSWICCNLEGNGNDLSNDEFISSAAEMVGVECVVEEPCDSGGELNKTCCHSHAHTHDSFRSCNLFCS